MATDFTVIDRILEDYRSRGYYPSAVCQVFRGNETLYRCAVGDVTPETWFDLASVSKLICTAMVLSAMEEGRLTPEDLILSRLPADGPGPVTRQRLSAVTVEQVMTHTSGIVPWSTCGAVYLATLGISAFQYAPYCFLAIINPLISILYAFTGWTLAPLDPSKPIKKSITVEEMNQS